MTERFNRSVRGSDFGATNPELSTSQFKVNGGLTFAGASGLPRTLWEGAKANFAPRIGLLWSPLQQTVVRAGYGIFYVPVGADRSSAIQSGYSLATSLTASLDNVQTYAASLSNPFPNLWPAPPGSSQGLATFLGRNVSFFNPRAVNPYMQRWSFGVQQ